MHFVCGEDVHVAGLGKGIVRDVRNGGRYLIELKGRSIVATEAQLTPVAERGGRGRKAEAGSAFSSEVPAKRLSSAASSLDLHGMTGVEAVAALDAFLNDALLAGHVEVRVIHGRSGGRIKASVHARLRQLFGPRAFRLDPRNHGVTIVTL